MERDSLVVQRGLPPDSELGSGRGPVRCGRQGRTGMGQRCSRKPLHRPRERRHRVREQLRRVGKVQCVLPQHPDPRTATGRAASASGPRLLTGGQTPLAGSAGHEDSHPGLPTAVLPHHHPGPLPTGVTTTIDGEQRRCPGLQLGGHGASGDRDAVALWRGCRAGACRGGAPSGCLEQVTDGLCRARRGGCLCLPRGVRPARPWRASFPSGLLLPPSPQDSVAHRV